MPKSTINLVWSKEPNNHTFFVWLFLIFLKINSIVLSNVLANVNHLNYFLHKNLIYFLILKEWVFDNHHDFSHICLNNFNFLKFQQVNRIFYRLELLLVYISLPSIFIMHL